MREPMPSGKFAPHARKVIFLEYSASVSDYKFCDRESRTLIVSRDAEFDERQKSSESLRLRATIQKSNFAGEQGELERAEAFEEEELAAQDEQKAERARREARLRREREDRAEELALRRV